MATAVEDSATVEFLPEDSPEGVVEEIVSSEASAQEKTAEGEVEEDEGEVSLFLAIFPSPP